VLGEGVNLRTNQGAFIKKKPRRGERMEGKGRGIEIGNGIGRSRRLLL